MLSCCYESVKGIKLIGNWKKFCHQLCQECGGFGFNQFLAYTGSTLKRYDTVLIDGVTFHLTQVITVVVSISPQSIETYCRKVPRTFFTKVKHISVLAVTVSYAYLEYEEKSGRPFISNF